MTVNRSCEVCGEQLGDVAFCTSCGTPTAEQTVGPRCGACGVGLEQGTVFCTNCGTAVGATPARMAARSAPPPAEDIRHHRALWLVAGVVTATVLFGVVVLRANRVSEQGATQPTSESRLDEAASDELDENSNSDGEVEETSPGVDDGATTSQPTFTSASTTLESTPTSTPTSTSALFASRDVVYGRYVAIMWSGLVADSESRAASDEVVEAQLGLLQARFGSNVIAIDSNQFGSLRNGTVAVAYDGGFSSARDAKRWCRDNGFPGTQDCFGVVLSDDFTPDQRGDLIRTYDL